MLGDARGAALGVFCPSDSARGRFNVPAVSWLLTIGVLVPLEGRAPSCANGLSEAGLEALFILIFGLGAGAGSGSTFIADGVEVGGVEDVLFSVFGIDGPASFSSLRLRI